MGNPGRTWEPGAKQKGKKKNHVNRNNHSLFKNVLLTLSCNYSILYRDTVENVT